MEREEHCTSIGSGKANLLNHPVIAKGYEKSPRPKASQTFARYIEKSTGDGGGVGATSRRQAERCTPELTCRVDICAAVVGRGSFVCGWSCVDLPPRTGHPLDDMLAPQ